MPSAYSNIVSIGVLQHSVAQTTQLQQSTLYALDTLSWNDIGAATYVVYRQINGGGFVAITEIDGPASGYVDEGIKDSPSFPAGTYQYFVAALNVNGEEIAVSAETTNTWS